MVGRRATKMEYETPKTGNIFFLAIIWEFCSGRNLGTDCDDCGSDYGVGVTILTLLCFSWEGQAMIATGSISERLLNWPLILPYLGKASSPQ